MSFFPKQAKKQPTNLPDLKLTTPHIPKTAERPFLFLRVQSSNHIWKQWSIHWRSGAEQRDDIWVHSFFLVHYKSNKHTCLGNVLTITEYACFASAWNPAGCFLEWAQVQDAAVSAEYSPHWQKWAGNTTVFSGSFYRPDAGFTITLNVHDKNTCLYTTSFFILQRGSNIYYPASSVNVSALTSETIKFFDCPFPLLQN